MNFDLKKIFQSKLFIPLSLIIFSIPAIYYLIRKGFYEPHDLHHIADIYEMVRAISSGQFPPRLGPDFIYNYGYPLFNFYYVLPFYLGSIFFFLFGSLTLSYKLVFVFSVFVSLFGMYLFLKEFFAKFPSLVGSIVYLYTPYRALQIYVRGAMGEAFALALFPFVGWIFIKIVKSQKGWKEVGLGIFICAAFLLSHNYIWAFTLPWLVFLSLLTTHKKQFIPTLIKLSVTGFLALGLAAYWWIPALIEQKLVTSQTPFPLIDHFPFIRQLIVPSWGYGASLWGPGDGLSFQIGVVNIIVILISLVFVMFFRNILKKKNILLVTVWSLIGFIFCLFFMNVRSFPVWKLLPFYNFIQFPWRLLFLTTFFTSILSCVTVEFFTERKQKYIGTAIIFLSVLLTFGYFRPSKIFYKSDNDYLSRFFANRTINGTKTEVSDDYLKYSEDYLLLPKWSEKKPASLPKEKITSQSANVSGISQITPIKWIAKVNAVKDSAVVFNSFYFPGWFAKVDGINTQISAGKPYGQMEIIVPKGNHEISFYWKETSFRRNTDFISLASLLITIALLFADKIRLSKRRKR